MSIFRHFGKKHVEVAGYWLGSAITFGATAGIGITYFTDWKAILQYLPYYNGKYTSNE